MNNKSLKIKLIVMAILTLLSFYIVISISNINKNNEVPYNVVKTSWTFKENEVITLLKEDEVYNKNGELLEGHYEEGSPDVEYKLSKGTYKIILSRPLQNSSPEIELIIK